MLAQTPENRHQALKLVCSEMLHEVIDQNKQPHEMLALNVVRHTISYSALNNIPYNKYKEQKICCSIVRTCCFD